MSNLLIRADATTDIGIGHVMRCLALAQAWQTEGNRAFFLSHCQSQDLRLRVESAGVCFIPLEKPHPSPGDLQETITQLQLLTAAWLVVDGYHFGPDYHHAIQSSGCRLLVIDDTAHLPEYHADILLNQNIQAEELPYCCDRNTKMLLGPQYTVLRPEFSAWHHWHREIPRVACKVLVTLGGADPDNITLKVIHAVKQMEALGLDLRIIVGSANPHLEILNHAVQYSTCNIHLAQNVLDMPEQMAWADVAIAAGGTTCLELAFMGVPTLILTLAKNQRGNAEGLARAGSAINLGWFNQVSVSNISAALGALLNNFQQRHRMHQAGQQLITGYGGSRVVQSMLDLTSSLGMERVSVRPATMSDSTDLWQLASDRIVRTNAFNPQPISFEHHVEWLKEKLTSPDTRIWILELDGGIAAQVRYDRVNADTAEIDFAVVSELRGKGLGARALALTCYKACAELGVKHLIGLALESNLPSAQSFKKAGFNLIGKGKYLHGRSCYVFERCC